MHLSKPAAIVLCASLAVSALALPSASSTVEAADPVAVPAPVDVSLTAAGFVPSSATVSVGGSLVVSNDTGGPTSLSNTSGVVSSGTLAPGERFVIAFASTGAVVITDASTPVPAALTVTVGQAGLVGPATALASAHVPDLMPPPPVRVVHPRWGLDVGQRRVLVRFRSTATVASANAALAASGLSVVGGVRRFGIVVAELGAVPSDAAGALADVLARLRADPAVEVAAMDVAIDVAASPSAGPRPALLPPPTDPATLGDYTWEVDRTGDRLLGLGGNWGLEQARFPQAWNMLDAIRDQQGPTPVDVAVIDSGFVAHPDLANVTIERFCNADGSVCTENRPAPSPGDSAALGLVNHGTATAGIIGATFRSTGAQGTVGAAPLASVHAVPWITENAIPVGDGLNSVSGMAATIGVVLDNRGAGFDNLRVINFSASGFRIESVEAWESTWSGRLCGPGDADDGTPAATQRCTPDNEDGYLTEFRAASEIARPVAITLATLDVVLVQSAGNQSDSLWCDSAGVCSSLDTRNINPFAHLDATWPDATSPFLIVEAHTIDLSRAGYSNRGGSISAPADGNVVPALVENPATGELAAGYAPFDGTSASAPYVSAAAAIVAAANPTLSADGIAALVVDGALPAPAPGQAPQLDVFNSVLLSLGSGLELADLNDPSDDGNRRVVRDDRGGAIVDDPIRSSLVPNVGEPWPVTEPDGRVDMRDLRAVRDAILRSCLELDLGESDGCPFPGAIRLDGSDDHPKFDLDGDGCVGCAGSDAVYARADLNGDGILVPSSFPTPFADDGTIDPRNPVERTDAEVLALYFGTGVGGGAGSGVDTEGWDRSDVPALMQSADIDIRLDGIWSESASSATIQVITEDVAGPVRDVTERPVPDHRPYTMPLQVTTDADPLVAEDVVQVVVRSIVAGEERVFLSVPQTVRIGDDIVVRPCTEQLTLESSSPLPLPDTAIPMTVQLTDCAGTPLANTAVQVAITAGDGATLAADTPSGPVGGTDIEVITDEAGTAVIEFTSTTTNPAVVEAAWNGAILGTTRVTSTVELGGRVAYELHYIHRQTVLDYERSTTNDYPGSDCAVTADGCFSSIQRLYRGPDLFGNPGWEPFVEQRGVVRIDDNGAVSVEREMRDQPLDRVGSSSRGIYVETEVETEEGTSALVSQFSVVPEGPRTGPVCTRPRTTDPFGCTEDFVSARPEGWIPRPQRPAIGASATVADDGAVVIGGLGPAVAGTGNAFGSADLARSNYVPGSPLAVPPDQLHPDVPLSGVDRFDAGVLPSHFSRELNLTGFDGTSFMVAPDPAGDLVFTPDGSGGFEPIEFCAARRRDIAVGPGFWSDDSPVMFGDFSGRDPDVVSPVREPGMRSAPTQDGYVLTRHEFVAVLLPAFEPSPDLSFPECADTTPDVTLAYDPEPAVEGVETTFTNVTGIDGEAILTPGDGSPAKPELTHVYTDNGTYPAQLSVTPDWSATISGPPVPVEVINALPVIESVGAITSEEGPVVTAVIDDAGAEDRLALNVRVSSPNPGFGPPVDIVATPPLDTSGTPVSGSYSAEVPLRSELAPGVYFLIIDVVDKDGGTATTTLQLVVSARAPSPARTAGFGGWSSAPRIDSLVNRLEEIVLRPAVAATPTAPPVIAAAFVLPGDGAAPGATVTLRNRSRSSGAAVAAVIEAGDGRPAQFVGADANVSIVWSEPGLVQVRVTVATPGVGLIAAAGFELSGVAAPPTVSYTGVTSGAEGAVVGVSALVTSGGLPSVGRTVRFTIGSVVHDAVTAPGGVAIGALRLPAPAGPTTLTVEVLASGTSTSSRVNVPFTVTPNAPPSVEAGGPYLLPIGRSLDLVATGTDADDGETATLVYDWDLDGDGDFDDASGRELVVDADTARQLLCGGTCTAGTTTTVTVRATDAKGGTDTDDALVTASADFAIQLSSATGLLTPNASLSFTVSVFSANGFDEPVALSVRGLPPGVSARFDPPVVTPDGRSLLTLTSDNSVAETRARIDVVGVSGDIERSTVADIDLRFGLLPQCTGTITGTVVDADTGTPLAGVPLQLLLGSTGRGATTDVNGRYTATGLTVGSRNEPVAYRVRALLNNRWPSEIRATAACGTPVEAPTLSLRLRRFATELTGRVMRADTVGNVLGPFEGASVTGVRTASNSTGVLTGADGRYRFAQVELNDQNALRVYSPQAQASGYFTAAVPNGVVVGPDASVEAPDIVLIEQCTGTARIRIVDSVTGFPVQGASLRSGPLNGITGSDGRATVAGIPLAAPRNNPVSRTFEVRYPSPYPNIPAGTVSVTIPRCEAIVPVDRTITFPTMRQATVRITVLDDDTSQPIEGAFVRLGGARTTDGNGVSEQVVDLGWDVLQRALTISIEAPGYTAVTDRSVTVVDGERRELVYRLRPFVDTSGTISGLVTDVATGQPVSGATVRISNRQVVTGPDGRYVLSGIPVGPGGAATTVSVSARGPISGVYWDTQRSVVLASSPPQVVDLALVPICRSNTVRGFVVDASNGRPLEGALVQLGFNEALTGRDGRFTLPPIPPGDGNSLYSSGVRVTKAGFVPVQRTIRLGCGADIFIDFSTNETGSATVRGVVTGLGGAPLQGVQVSDGFGESVLTDSLGRYRLDVSVPGNGAPKSVRLRATPPVSLNYAVQEAELELINGAQVVRNFALSAVPPPPTALGQSLATDEDDPLPVTLAGIDPAADGLVFTILTPPTRGELSGVAPNLVYTPDANVSGDDSFTFRVSAGGRVSTPAQVDITVRDVPEAPTIVLVPDAPETEGISIGVRAVVSDGDVPASQVNAHVSVAWDTDGDGEYDDGTGLRVSLRLPEQGTRQVSARATDVTGRSTDADPVTLEWLNDVPELSFDFRLTGNPVRVPVGGRMQLSGTALDLGELDVLTGSVDYGDGSGVMPLDVVRGTDPTGVSGPRPREGVFELSHVFASTGVFIVKVDVCDDDGDCGSAEVPAVVGDIDATPELAIEKRHELAGERGGRVAWTLNLRNDSVVPTGLAFFVDFLPVGVVPDPIEPDDVPAGWLCLSEPPPSSQPDPEDEFGEGGFGEGGFGEGEDGENPAPPPPDPRIPADANDRWTVSCVIGNSLATTVIGAATLLVDPDTGEQVIEPWRSDSFVIRGSVAEDVPDEIVNVAVLFGAGGTNVDDDVAVDPTPVVPLGQATTTTTSTTSPPNSTSTTSSTTTSPPTSTSTSTSTSTTSSTTTSTTSTTVEPSTTTSSTTSTTVEPSTTTSSTTSTTVAPSTTTSSTTSTTSTTVAPSTTTSSTTSTTSTTVAPSTTTSSTTSSTTTSSTSTTTTTTSTTVVPSVPTAVISGPPTIDEGASVRWSSIDSRAAAGATIIGVSWDVGDDGIVDGDGPAIDLTLPDEGSVVVVLTVTDDRGGQASARRTLTAVDVAPRAVLDAPPSVAGDGSITIQGGIVDPGVLDQQAITVDWGDGSSPTVLAPSGGRFAASYQFAPRALVQRLERATTPITMTLRVCDVALPTACTTETYPLAVPVSSEPASDLSVGLQVSRLVAGERATLTITVTNSGPSSAAEVTVAVLLPPGVSSPGSASDGWRCTASDSSGRMTCVPNVLPLSVGSSSLSVPLDTAASLSTELVFDAVASSSTADQTMANNRAIALGITAQAPPPPPAPTPAPPPPAPMPVLPAGGLPVTGGTGGAPFMLFGGVALLLGWWLRRLTRHPRPIGD